MSCGLRDVMELRIARPAGGARRLERVRAGGRATRSAARAARRSRRVLVAHPIQDRTDDELRAMAGALVDHALAAIRA